MKYCAGILCALLLIGGGAIGQIVAKPHRLGGVSGQSGGLVYDNIGETVFTSSLRPPYILDDAALTASSTKANCINIGYNVSAGANVDLLIDVIFYESVNYAAGSGLMTSGLLNSFTITVLDVAPGTYETGLVDFSSLFTLNVADGNLGVAIRFRQGSSLSTRATIVFMGTGVTLGSSQDWYGRDVNANDAFDAGENRRFTGGTTLANFYMQLGYAPPAATLNGHVNLQFLAGSPAGQAVRIELRIPNTTNAVAIHDVNLDASGNYQITGITPGTYDISAKGVNWLRQVLSSVNVTGAVTGDFDLTNGDCDSSNAIDVFDLNTILSRFGMGVGDGDIDWSSVVDVFDLNIVFGGFGQQGQP